jgi:hypothetical protein
MGTAPGRENVGGAQLVVRVQQFYGDILQISSISPFIFALQNAL